MSRDPTGGADGCQSAKVGTLRIRSQAQIRQGRHLQGAGHLLGEREVGRARLRHRHRLTLH